MPRWLKWIAWTVGTAVTLFALFCAAMITLLSAMFGEPSRDEVQRMVSPNGRHDAVLYETNGGATTSFGYQVYVVEHGAHGEGKPTAYLDASQRGASASGANLRWRSDSDLRIEYFRARDPIIHHKQIVLGAQPIHVAFSPAVSDPDAPSGGMLYNLQHKGKLSDKAPASAP